MHAEQVRRHEEMDLFVSRAKEVTRENANQLELLLP